MSIRSLRRQLGRLSLMTGLRRCACGAILPAALTQPRRIDIRDSYALPEALEALVRLATPAEALELQGLLNRCLEQHPVLAQRRGTGHQIYGEPSDSALLRFDFANPNDARPHCPRCGTAVVSDDPVSSVVLMAPPPEELLDLLRLEPQVVSRFTALTTAWQRRAGQEIRSLLEREPSAGTTGDNERSNHETARTLAAPGAQRDV